MKEKEGKQHALPIAAGHDYLGVRSFSTAFRYRSHFSFLHFREAVDTLTVSVATSI